MLAVGYDLYTKLLQAAVKEIKGEIEEEEIQPVLELDISAYISDEYISNAAQKMEIYRRIASVDTVEEADDLEEEVEDRFEIFRTYEKPYNDISFKGYCKQT